MLELLDIHKHFGAVRANDGVTMRVDAGSIHGLLGENGAGKSTLMKVLAGFITADSGQIVLGGERLEVSNPKESVAAGIGLLHQDPLLCLPFSVLDNFLLGRPESMILDREAARVELEELAARFDFQFSPTATTRTLTLGERQQLEILRLLSLGVRVLILDEPTTAISATQRALLFATLRKLAAEGLTVIFVSHKLEEVDEICDRATVLRAGQVAGETELPVPTAGLVSMMFGKAIVPEERTDVAIGEPVLELANITAAERLVTLRNVSLQAHAGEVIGLAGLTGSGQQTMLRVCAGQRKPDQGVVLIHGKDITGSGYNHHLDQRDVWFPKIGSLDISWLSLLLAASSIIGVYILMRGTIFGLRLKAIGNNMQSSARLGIPSNRYMLGAFAVAGGLAGLAGTTQAMAFHHKLVPSISGGFGFFGILVVLLAGFRAAPVAPLALFFAALSVGSSQLELRLDLDSSVGGVIQGVLVLFVLLAAGWQRRRAELRAIAAQAEGGT